MPGTRNHHCFIPVNDEQLRLFRISADVNGTLVTNATESAKILNILELCIPGKYVAAVYDQKWYAGNIVQCDKEKEDVLVNFMRADDTTGSNFQWPRKKDECWVPTEHILCILPVPATATRRHYRFDDDILAETEALFRKFAEIHF